MAGKALLITLLGLILCFSGIIFTYLFMESLATGANYLQLVGALVLIGTSVFSFIIASKGKILGIYKINNENVNPKDDKKNADQSAT